MKILATTILCLSYALTPITAVHATEYAVDTGHSALIFGIQHIGLGNTYGRFNDFSGTITFDAEDLAGSAVRIAAKIGSIDTDNTKRDSHLRAADVFDAATYPEMSFVGTGFTATERDDHYTVSGTLTIRGISKEIIVPFHKVGEAEHFAKKPAIGFEGEFIINPHDFGVGQGDVQKKPSVSRHALSWPLKRLPNSTHPVHNPRRGGTP